jgi:hypothetical protein
MKLAIIGEAVDNMLIQSFAWEDRFTKTSKKACLRQGKLTRPRGKG